MAYNIIQNKLPFFWISCLVLKTQLRKVEKNMLRELFLFCNIFEADTTPQDETQACIVLSCDVFEASLLKMRHKYAVFYLSIYLKLIPILKMGHKHATFVLISQTVEPSMLICRSYVQVHLLRKQLPVLLREIE